MTKLTDYFNPKKNVAYERHIFRQATQKRDETVDNFIVRLKKLSVSCEFPDGTVSDQIRDQVIETCARTNELADLHATKMNGTTNQRQPEPTTMPHDEDALHLDRRDRTPATPARFQKKRKQFAPRGMPKSSPKPTRFKSCYRCGGKGHTSHECLKSRNIICNDCKRRGHFAHMCRTRDKREVRFMQNEEPESNDEYVFGINSDAKSTFVSTQNLKEKQCKTSHRQWCNSEFHG